MILLAMIFLACGCAGPISVERLDHATLHQELTRNVLSARTLSDQTRNVLRQWDLEALFYERPEYAISELHAAFAEGRGQANELFALAEMSFVQAAEHDNRPYYLASALYAYAFLFPGSAGQPPDPYDPRLRLASDLYNRGLTSGLATDEGTEITIRSAIYQLPLGQLDISFDPRDLAWGGRQLTGFFPVAELEIHGLNNRYRQSGIGAPLAAGTAQAYLTTGFQVAPRVKTPVTALLRVDDPWRQLGSGTVHGQLELYAASDAGSVLIDHRQVPLEIEYTASLAYMLSGVPAWELEYVGFLRGNLLDRNVPSRLVALEPYRSGRIPVVFVHGTASSPVRWAEMLNDLRSGPRIRDYYQFWFFAYETGNPVPYSALLLREALQNAIAALDPDGTDPSLHEMVVIGHSQGGLLAKMAAIDTGDRFWNAAFKKPPEELDVSPESREMLKSALFIKPFPSVKRLIFIATPHGGSYVAGDRISHYIASLVRLPGNILKATSEVGTLGIETSVLAGQAGFGSIYGMTPGSLLVQMLARTPIAQGVKAHSIIAVRGDGPVETGDDGVVDYRSAHIEGAESEYVVRSGHSTQSDPHTIEEVRRILLLHLAESCVRSGICGAMPNRLALVAGKPR
ncbi:hypothetical protein N825_28645 [Skermanella stibiiresistens SB22]|uniref:AB hydrolase-1 domain-containing protein n=1 Tax=Skermanella stibiiresistens SB22 TaxID=1385369 RepID=W9GQZ4_9PROT|nr:alpha/beta hydrolase [Skermanella stibiiresistens]EWY36315.1 hypothetical protein N825_28645 [Skermanella stibiiresistens SB22]